MGSSFAVVVNLWLCWSSASLVARLHAHDEAAIDSVEHGVDGDGAAGLSRSGAARVVATNARLRNQFASLALFNRSSGNRKDRSGRTNQRRAGRRNLDSVRR